MATANTAVDLDKLSAGIGATRHGTEAGAQTGTPDRRWSLLYKAGARVALSGVAIIPIQLIVFMTWPPPSTGADGFALFGNSKLGGLPAFGFLFVFRLFRLGQDVNKGA